MRQKWLKMATVNNPNTSQCLDNNTHLSITCKFMNFFNGFLTSQKRPSIIKVLKNRVKYSRQNWWILIPKSKLNFTEFHWAFFHLNFVIQLFMHSLFSRSQESRTGPLSSNINQSHNILKVIFCLINNLLPTDQCSWVQNF